MNCVNCQKQYTGNRKYCSTKCFNEFNVVDFEELKEKEDKIVHNNPFECVICKTRFKTETMLNTHTLFEHETFRPYCGTDDSSQKEETLAYVSIKFDKMLNDCHLECAKTSNDLQPDHCHYLTVDLATKKRLKAHQVYCKHCGAKKKDVKKRWMDGDVSIVTFLTTDELAMFLAGWKWVENKTLVYYFESRYKIKGVLRAIRSSKNFKEIDELSTMPYILRDMGIKKTQEEEQKRIWVEHKSLRDIGLTKEAEFISEMIYGTGGDYDARNRNRINVIKLLYFKEDEEE